MQNAFRARIDSEPDRPPAPAAERRREERAIRAIRPKDKDAEQDAKPDQVAPEEATGAVEPVAVPGWWGQP